MQILTRCTITWITDSKSVYNTADDLFLTGSNDKALLTVSAKSSAATDPSNTNNINMNNTVGYALLIDCDTNTEWL